MTIKDASQKFGLTKDTLYKLCRESKAGHIKFVNAIKNICWEISDDTEVIMTKEQIRFSLVQILKYKNNSQCVLSRKTFPDKRESKIFDYLCELGFISKRKNSSYSLEECMADVQLTDEGIDFILQPIQSHIGNNVKSVSIISLNNTNKIACLS